VTKLERPRGTHDILPAEQPLWRRVTDEIERLCALYGYRPIQTPVFEDTDLFQRTSGQGSDVVQKEMYTFADRSDRSLTLRPEGTAPICRAYVEHGLHREAQPQKLYTIASMYRYGAPGRGRYREHWQLSVEAIGSDDPAIDAEIVQLYDTLLHRLGVTSYRLELNSIGCRECRPAYVEKLRTWLGEHEAELDEATRETMRRRRSAIRSATPASSISRPSAPTSTRRTSVTSSSRRSSAASITTRARPGSSSGRWGPRTRRSPAADVTTTWWRRSAGRPRRASASAPGSSGC
jgi:histidyl-tRNA synthetase